MVFDSTYCQGGKLKNIRKSIKKTVNFIHFHPFLWFLSTLD